MTPKFIVLEGIDGCGSTTQARLLAEAIPNSLLTREPSDGPVGKLIRQILTRQIERPFDWRSMGLLFAADRVDHVMNEIEPALNEGRTVISDRYDLSSLTYQLATSPDESSGKWLVTLNSKVRRPDVTVILDVDAGVAAKRRAFRGGIVELFEDDPLLQRRLVELYSRAEQLVPDDLVLHLDGNQSLEMVQRAINEMLDVKAA